MNAVNGSINGNCLSGDYILPNRPKILTRSVSEHVGNKSVSEMAEEQLYSAENSSLSTGLSTGLSTADVLGDSKLYPDAPPEDDELNARMELLYEEYRKVERDFVAKRNDNPNTEKLSTATSNNKTNRPNKFKVSNSTRHNQTMKERLVTNRKCSELNSTSNGCQSRNNDIVIKNMHRSRSVNNLHRLGSKEQNENHLNNKIAFKPNCKPSLNKASGSSTNNTHCMNRNNCDIQQKNLYSQQKLFPSNYSRKSSLPNSLVQHDGCSTYARSSRSRRNSTSNCLENGASFGKRSHTDSVKHSDQPFRTGSVGNITLNSTDCFNHDEIYVKLSEILQEMISLSRIRPRKDRHMKTLTKIPSPVDSVVHQLRSGLRKKNFTRQSVVEQQGFFHNVSSNTSVREACSAASDEEYY